MTPPPQSNEDVMKRSFGTIHVIDSKSDHTHTAIMLHGRGSTGEEFAEEFFASTLSDGESLLDKLPGWRWVFPSSQTLWSTAFQEDMPSWFEAHSLTDITARQDLQIAGIRDSVDHISSIVSGETTRLYNDVQKLTLGGISQGGAVALWTLLCHEPAARPGMVVVTNTWLPFAANIERLYLEDHSHIEFDSFVEEMMGMIVVPKVAGAEAEFSHRSLPVFVGHGVDDAYVDVELGRQAASVLSLAGLRVAWKEYSGAEEEGHWFKVPEEMNDIHLFLTQIQRPI